MSKPWTMTPEELDAADGGNAICKRHHFDGRELHFNSTFQDAVAAECEVRKLRPRWGDLHLASAAIHAVTLA
ncbi:hypothetical protein ACFELC_23740 [Pseudomonas aeruginosa]|uniref:hypothetical protein n=1 Tax=Pseudomonas aeruginosa TaxID=287 RepID=UPI00383B920D